MITEKELPKPRFYRVSHPRLRKIRDGFRKVFQLAVIDMWRTLLDEKSRLREGGLAPEDKERYSQLTRMANYVKRCCLNSVISNGRGHLGGDVSGDRVRVYSVKCFGTDDEPIYVLHRHFVSLEQYEIYEEWYEENYNHYAPKYKHEHDKFMDYLDFHYKGFTPKWDFIQK